MKIGTTTTKIYVLKDKSVTKGPFMLSHPFQCELPPQNSDHNEMQLDRASFCGVSFNSLFY